MSLSAGDADRFERKASMATELSWKKRAEHSLSDLVLSFMNAGLMHLGDGRQGIGHAPDADCMLSWSNPYIRTSVTCFRSGPVGLFIAKLVLVPNRVYDIDLYDVTKY